MLGVRGRVLFPPTVYYGGDKQIDQRVLARGGWNIMEQQFAAPAKSSTWTFLQVCFEKDTNVIQDDDLIIKAQQLEAAMPVCGIDDHEIFCPLVMNWITTH